MAKRPPIHPVWFALSVLVLLVVVYQPSLGGDYLWDDDDNYLGSVVVRETSGIWRIWTDLRSTQQYYPLTHTTFWLQYQLTGELTWPLRVVNLLLHAGSSFLVWRLLQRLSVPGALFAAAAFCLHPLHVESVAWITERKNTLSLPLYLGATIFFLRHHGVGPEQQGATKDSRRKDYFWSLGLFFLALAAKTSLAVLPVILALLLFWKKGHLTKAAGIGLAPFFALGIGAGLITAWIEVVDIGAQGAFFDFTPWEKLLRAAKIFWFYILKLALPIYQSFIYPRWPIDAGDLRLWGYLGATLAAGGGALWLHIRGRGSGPLVALLTYAVAIFPALGFANVLFMRWAFVQDHFCYGASIPVLALISAGAARLLSKARKREVSFAAGLALLCLTLLARVHAARFTDYVGLFEHSLTYAPKCWLTNFNLGNEYTKQGREAEAIERYRTALEDNPGLQVAQMNLATLLFKHGQTDEALHFARLAAQDESDPANPIQRQYAVALARAGRHADAIDQLELQLERHPDWTKGNRLLAELLAAAPDRKLRDGKRAVQLAEKACAATKDTLPRCLSTLAVAHAETKNWESAALAAEKAARLSQQEKSEKEASFYREQATRYRTKLNDSQLPPPVSQEGSDGVDAATPVGPD